MNIFIINYVRFKLYCCCSSWYHFDIIQGQCWITLLAIHNGCYIFIYYIFMHKVSLEKKIGDHELMCFEIFEQTRKMIYLNTQFTVRPCSKNISVFIFFYMFDHLENISHCCIRFNQYSSLKTGYMLPTHIINW